MRQWSLRGITVMPVAERGPRPIDEVPARDLRALLDQFPGLVWTADADLVFTTILGRGLETVGLGPNQLVGTRLQDLFDDPDGGAAASRAHRGALAGDTRPLVLRLGDRRLHARVAPLVDARGAVIGVIGLAVDEAGLGTNALAPTA